MNIDDLTPEDWTWSEAFVFTLAESVIARGGAAGYGLTHALQCSHAASRGALARARVRAIVDGLTELRERQVRDQLTTSGRWTDVRN